MQWVHLSGHISPTCKKQHSQVEPSWQVYSLTKPSTQSFPLIYENSREILSCQLSTRMQILVRRVNYWPTGSSRISMFCTHCVLAVGVCFRKNRRGNVPTLARGVLHMRLVRGERKECTRTQAGKRRRMSLNFLSPIQSFEGQMKQVWSGSRNREERANIQKKKFALKKS